MRTSRNEKQTGLRKARAFSLIFDFERIQKSVKHSRFFAAAEICSRNI
jgi:hypothetical protein